jgi:hypothetical protein
MTTLSQSIINIRGPFGWAHFSSNIFLCSSILLLVIVSDVNLHSLGHRLVRSLRDRHAPTEILMRAPIAALPRGHTVASMATLNPLWSPYVTRSLISVTSSCGEAATTVGPTLIEICTCLTLLAPRRGAVKVIKHQVHVCALLPLQVIYYCFISVYLYFYIRFCLAGERPRFMKITTCSTTSWLLLLLLLGGYGRIVQSVFMDTSFQLLLLLMPLPLLLCLLIVADVEGLPSCG